MAMTLTGLAVSSRLKKRKELLEELVSFHSCLKIDFSYSVLPLERIAEKYAKEDSFRELSFLGRCFAEIQNGADFPFAWETAVEKEYLLSSSEKAKLSRLGSLLGTSSAEQQVNMLCMYEEYFKAYYKASAEAFDKFSKPAIFTGVFVGFALFVLFI